MKPILVYICSAHSTGKSTVINEYCKYLEGKGLSYGRNPSPRTLVPTDKLYTQVDDLHQMYITFGVLADMTNTFENTQLYVTDRWLIDNMAYSNLSPLITEKLHYIHQCLLAHFLKVWDVRVFYIPIEFDLEKDGVRPEDLEYQKKVDDLLKELLCYFQMPYITLRGTTERRLAALIDEARV